MGDAGGQKPPEHRSVCSPPCWAMVSAAESHWRFCCREKADKKRLCDKMPLPDWADRGRPMASKMVRAHEPMTIKPAKQRRAIEIERLDRDGSRLTGVLQ
jgi:hypothetical protein